MTIQKVCLCAILGVLCSISACAQITESSPRPPAQFPGRKPPTMKMEDAIAAARKALEKHKIPLGARFISNAECVFDMKRFPGEAADFSKGPVWLITLRDPEYANADYPIASILVLVAADDKVLIVPPK